MTTVQLAQGNYAGYGAVNCAIAIADTIQGLDKANNPDVLMYVQGGYASPNFDVGALYHPAAWVNPAYGSARETFNAFSTYARGQHGVLNPSPWSIGYGVGSSIKSRFWTIPNNTAGMGGAAGDSGNGNYPGARLDGNPALFIMEVL